MPTTPSGAESSRSPRDGATATPTPTQTPAGVTPRAEPGDDRSLENEADPISTEVLIEQLQADRLWLLRQIDSGAYPELRLDLAALERELGQLLDQAGERLVGS